MQIILMWIVEVVVSAILELMVVAVGHGIARLLLPILSFRRIAVRPFGGPSARFNLLGYRRIDPGRIEIEATAAGVFGLLIGIAVCVAIVLLARATE